MSSDQPSTSELRRELAEARALLAEATTTLDAIRRGEVDGVVVAGPQGKRVFTLKGEEEPYRLLIEQMSEGALTLSAAGVILYANERFARLLQLPLGQVIGAELLNFVPPADQPGLAGLVKEAWNSNCQGTLSMRTADGSLVPLRLGLSPLHVDTEALVCVVATDLTEVRKKEAELRRLHADLEKRVAERTAELSASRLAALNMMEEAVEARKHAEQTNDALRESEERFRAIFEHSTIGKSRTSPEGKLLEVNAAFAGMLGLTIPELEQVNFASVTHPDDMVESRECIRCLLANERTSYRMEKRYRHREGHYVWTDVSTKLLRDAQGQPHYFITTVHDISERKQAEQALRASEIRYRRLFETTKDGILTLDAETGMVMEVNPFLIELLGFSHEAFLGKKVWELGFLKDLVANQENFAELQAKEYIRYEDMAMETSDGRRIEVEFTSSVYLVNHQKVIQCNIRDISPRKAAEEKQRASDLRYRRLFESTKDGILILDGETGMVMDTNPFLIELLGFSHAEFLGRKIWELGFFKDLVANQDNFAELQRKEYIRYDDMALESSDGRRIEVEFTSNVYQVNHQRVIQCDIRDITARKLAKMEILRLNADLENRVRERTAELLEANKELETFAYSVSHDLRAPLRAMDGFSRIALTQHATELSPQVKEALQIVRASSQQMGQLIDGLLTFSRLGRQALRKQTVATRDLVRECLVTLRPEMEGRRVEITTGELPVCAADPGLLRQVWMNLLANALKYSRKSDPARIEIGCRRNGECVYFVRDNGVGFNMAYAHKLFGVFQRLHRAEDFEGTGVGLATVQRILHRHGGRIWAEAELNKGATFFFTVEAAPGGGNGSRPTTPSNDSKPPQA